MQLDEKTEDALSNVEAVDFGSLFEGTELTEDFKDKLKLIFESAVSVKVGDKVAAITEELEAKFEETLEETKADLTEKIDAFLNYAINEWIEDNKIQLETGIRNEITENFITGLKDLFNESYIDIPEEKYDVLGEMEVKVENLEEKLNDQLEKNIELHAKISGLIKESIIAEESKGLTAIDAEKLKSLVEHIGFESEEVFQEKVATIKENYFPKTSAKQSQITEHVQVEQEDGKMVEVPAYMKKYMEALSRI